MAKKKETKEPASKKPYTEEDKLRDQLTVSNFNLLQAQFQIMQNNINSQAIMAQAAADRLNKDMKNKAEKT